MFGFVKLCLNLFDFVWIAQLCTNFVLVFLLSVKFTGYKAYFTIKAFIWIAEISRLYYTYNIYQIIWWFWSNSLWFPVIRSEKDTLKKIMWHVQQASWSWCRGLPELGKIEFLLVCSLEVPQNEDFQFLPNTPKSILLILHQQWICRRPFCIQSERVNILYYLI